MSGDESPGSGTRRFATPILFVAGVFCAYSLLSVPIPGVNEPHYLCKARAFAEPEWCSKDIFLQSANAHAVFFAVVGPVTQVLSFEVTAVLGRIVSSILLAIGWVWLGERLRLSAPAIQVSACLFCLISATGNFSGEWVVGGFESKVPSYGLALMAVAMWIDAWRTQSWRTYLIAGTISGAAVALHPVVGLWFCVAMAISEVFLFFTKRSPVVDRPRRRIFPFLVHATCFISAAVTLSLPGLVPVANRVLWPEVERASQDAANFIQVYSRLAHHLDPGNFSAFAWIHTLVLALIGISTAVILRRQADDVAPESHASDHPWSMSSFPFVALVVSSALIAGLGIVIGWHAGPASEIPDWQWRAALMRFYPFRLFDALLPIATSLALGSILLNAIDRRITNRAVIATSVIAVCLTGWAIRLDAPRGFTAHSFSEWKDACDWLDQQTPIDSVVYGPRESFALKWFANRAEYVSYKDCPQDPAGILEWNRRLWKIYHWSSVAYRDEIFDDTDLQKLHGQTGVTHLLTRQLGPFESSPVYHNDVWRIYELPSSTE